MFGADLAATVVYASQGLTVSVASPGYLFAMKAAAARVERDAADLKTLYRLNGFKNAQEALDFIETTFPTARLLPKTGYLIEGIAAEADQQP